MLHLGSMPAVRKIQPRKRILIATHLVSPPGGVEMHVLNLCRLLVEHGAEVTLATRFAKRDVPVIQQRRSIPIHWLSTPFYEIQNPRWRRFSTAWAMTFWRRHLRRQFDVLFTLEMTWFVDFLVRFVKANGYVIANRFALPSHAAPFDPRAKARLHGFVTESSFQADLFRKECEMEVPIAVIPFLTNVRTSPPRRGKRTIDQLRIAYLGRIEPDKGVYTLVELWRDLRIQPARLDFHGGGEVEDLRDCIRLHGLAEQAQVHGPYTSDDLPDILANSDLVVLPSRREGLPLVLMEAMAHGVPFVATAVGAVHTLAENNPDVLVVAPNKAALIDGLNEMAAAIRSGAIDPARLQQYHHERYSYEQVSSEWVKALLDPERFWNISLREAASLV
jgi:glycosyltransferase involved in cell wall biosynthesis